MNSNKLQPRKEKALAIIRELKRLFPRPKIALHYSNNWELLVAVVLSAQCTDKKVNEVTAKLFKKYRKLDDYIKARRSAFAKDIKPSGFYKNKAKSILASAKIIKGKFGGKLPRTMEQMLTLPGIGRKSANVILGNAYGIVEGIAVDTHVRRLAQKLGLSKHSDPDKIEQDLMKLLPKKEWPAVTYRLIDYGRKYCPAKDKKHFNCPLKRFYK